ncbi:MAG: class I mannose-6-phosphate isomerase, partial [Planctomycetes bacterium]|nr:class I mannose-6-phosphate isomerase [Planctomycetota bacterium]
PARHGLFPLLLKLLDSSDYLSIQVHPDDAQSERLGEPDGGKTEMWHVLSSAPSSELICGLAEGVTKKQFQTAIEDGSVSDLLCHLNVLPGSTVFVPAGTVHAIGAGILLAEIQQSSDLTFRLYDWGRLGSDGQPRPLHIDAAITCTDFSRGPVNPLTPFVEAESSNKRERLVECDYFVLLRHTVRAPFSLPADNRFCVLMALSGTCELSSDGETQTLSRGQTLLVPADCSAAEIRPRGDDEVILLETRLP